MGKLGINGKTGDKMGKQGIKWGNWGKMRKLGIKWENWGLKFLPVRSIYNRTHYCNVKKIKINEMSKFSR